MPRLCLTNPLRGPCPPDGYRYVFPHDGFLCHAWTYVDWVDVAKAHLRANNESIPETLEDDMQEQICLTLPPGWCSYDDPNRPRPNTVLSWDDVKRGVETYGSWITKGMPEVDRVESDRRAAICSRCYLNVSISGCSACQAAAQKLAVHFQSKYDPFLRACAVCKCVLRAKIHFPMSLLDKESGSLQEMYPGFCWLNKLSENYRG